MPNTVDARAQFSIYKIDASAVITILKLQEDSSDRKQLIPRLINHIKDVVTERKGSKVYDIDYEGFTGLIFRTVHTPAWATLGGQLINASVPAVKDRELKSFLTNSNISYILFHASESHVYAMTGGFGSVYLKNFIVKNHGLYLLPKILDKNSPVLKQITDNNIIGNRASSSRHNRRGTSFAIEQDASNIFRQARVELEADTVEAFGIAFDNKKPKQKISIENKDSLVIRRSFSLKQIKEVIKGMWKVEIADCIFWDNEGLYLMHNKGKFGGIGARDLTNQIATAAELVHKALNSPDRRRFLEEYYLKIEERYRERGNTLSLSKDDFIENFATKPITFIAAYVNSFSPNSGSNYAKYLSISLEKRLAANSYSCISMAL